MFEENTELKLNSTEKKIQMLKLRLERFEKAFSDIYTDIDLSEKELSSFLNTASNFPPEVWNQLEIHRFQLDNKLKKDLENICNPQKTKETYEQRKGIKPHWLFVR